LNDDYAKIVNMQEIAEQSYDLMEAYLLADELVNKKLQAANESLKEAQKKFAVKNNITLVEGKTDVGEMLKKVGEVHGYHDPIYLIFFKSYKQEMYLAEAIETKNITGIGQNKNTLLKYAQAGLKELEGQKPFEGDNSLLNACKKALQFYATMAGETITPILDHILLNEQFEKIQKDYDKKSNHTKEDVDLYNKSVKDINAAVAKSNAANQQVFEQRSEVIDAWNQAEDNFYDRHIPVYK
jgi:hypothetical protein